MKPINTVILGCGYVSEYYMITSKNYNNFVITGAYDRNIERLSAFCKFYGLRSYKNFKELTDDPKVELVINLTNPQSHYELSKELLKSGKNVYTEKPIALSYKESISLFSIASENNVYFGAAPVNQFSLYARKLKDILNKHIIGNPILVYATLDDGPVYRMRHDLWRTKTNIPWPIENELSTGCTYEHSAYVFTLLVELFGFVKKMVVCADCIDKNKLPKSSINYGVDFSNIILYFSSGLVAKVTVGLIAPADHSLLITGTEGIACLKSLYWNYFQPVFYNKYKRNESDVRSESHIYLSDEIIYDNGETDDFIYKSSDEVQTIFSFGISNLASMIKNKSLEPSYYSKLLHVHELVTNIQICFEGNGHVFDLQTKI
jgi:predicted dehydrogenase